MQKPPHFSSCIAWIRFAPLTRSNAYALILSLPASLCTAAIYAPRVQALTLDPRLAEAHSHGLWNYEPLAKRENLSSGDSIEPEA